jgi:hypothetical protein
MPVIFLDNTSFSQVINYTCELTGQNFLDIYTNHLQSLQASRYKLDQIADLNNLTDNQSLGFFDDSIQYTFKLVDFQTLEIDKNFIDFCKKLDLDISTYIFYSRVGESLATETKKLIKVANFDYVDQSKIDGSVMQKIAVQYSQQINLNLDPNTLNIVITSSRDYEELINNLDFLVLCPDPKQSALQLQLPTKPLLYTYPFNPSQLSVHIIKQWLDAVDDGELQLALSLIYTKMIKLNNTTSKQILSNLIETDRLIKNSKLNPLTWWKFFLFKARLY